MNLSLLLSVVLSILASADALAAERLLILGDSLTEGLGVEPEEAYPAVLDAMLKKAGHSEVEVVAAGISGSTAASGVGRLKWALKGPKKPTALLLELGANDGLRGRKVEEIKRDLKETLELAKKSGVRIMLAGMKMPVNYTAAYRDPFEKIYPALAKETGAFLLPFLLDGVGGDPKLNQADGIHPNAEGHRILAEKSYPHVVKFLGLASAKKASP